MDTNAKLYYSIKEVARLFSISESNLRSWEKTFTWINPKRNGKGNRLYTAEDIKQIELINHLVNEKGMTLQGAKDKILFDKKFQTKDFDVLTELKQLKKEITSIKKSLDLLKDSDN